MTDFGTVEEMRCLPMFALTTVLLSNLNPESWTFALSRFSGACDCHPTRLGLKLKALSPRLAYPSSAEALDVRQEQHRFLVSRRIC